MLVNNLPLHFHVTANRVSARQAVLMQVAVVSCTDITLNLLHAHKRMKMGIFSGISLLVSFAKNM